MDMCSTKMVFAGKISDGHGTKRSADIQQEETKAQMALDPQWRVSEHSLLALKFHWTPKEEVVNTQTSKKAESTDESRKALKEACAPSPFTLKQRSEFENEQNAKMHRNYSGHFLVIFEFCRFAYPRCENWNARLSRWTSVENRLKVFT